MEEEMRLKAKKHIIVLSAILALFMLLMLGGCVKRDVASEPAEPAAPTEQPVGESEPGSQDGESFEGTIMPEVSEGGLSDESLSITGTWQTASMQYADDGTVYPEYHVQFTDSDILYGHMKDGQFVLDHSDRIVHLEKTAAGGFIVQAEASNGTQYTYQTCESDDDILEYYETWREEDFPDMYRGGASLSRSA